MITVHTAPDNFDSNIWDNLATHPMQSWEWGEIRKSEGKKIIRFVEYDKENTVHAVYQMTLHPIPYVPYSIGYIPKSGPPSDEFLSYLKDYGKKHKILFIKFEPNTTNPLKIVNCPDAVSDKSDYSNVDPALSRLLIGALRDKLNIVKSPHPLFTPWNQILDISTAEDDLLKSMHHKTRYNIRLAQKKGVTIHQMDTDAGYAIFEQLYFDTCKRQHYHGHTPTYHRNIWHHLSLAPVQPLPPAMAGTFPKEGTYEVPPYGRGDPAQILERGGRGKLPLQKLGCLPSSGRGDPDQILERGGRGLSSHLLVAYYQDKPLAVFQLWHYKNTLYYVYGGSSEEHKNVMAANLLMWEAIKLGKSLGCTQLDMWGSLPPKYDTQDPWAGFTKFKEGYGTKFIEYVGSYDLVIDPTIYRIYNMIHSIRQKLL